MIEVHQTSDGQMTCFPNSVSLEFSPWIKVRRILWCEFRVLGWFQEVLRSCVVVGSGAGSAMVQGVPLCWFWYGVWVAGLVPDGSRDFGAGSRVVPGLTSGPWEKKPGREVPGFQAFADQDQSSPWVKPVLSKQQMEEAAGSTRDFRIRSNMEMGNHMWGHECKNH